MFDSPNSYQKYVPCLCLMIDMSGKLYNRQDTKLPEKV